MKTKIKRESISVYFLERCGGGPKSKDFWPTIKPFLSQKSTIKDDPNIILIEDEKLISDQNIVSEKMNDFYVNIAQNIDINSTSIKKIKEQNLNKNFEFSAITEKQVSTCIKTSSQNKHQELTLYLQNYQGGYSIIDFTNM